MPVNPYRRLESESYDLTIQLGEGVHRMTLTIARDSADVPREVVFSRRGKPGHGLDLMLTQLGIAISRAIQRRDPDTGVPVDPPPEPLPTKPTIILVSEKYGRGQPLD